MRFPPANAYRGVAPRAQLLYSYVTQVGLTRRLAVTLYICMHKNTHLAQRRANVIDAVTDANGCATSPQCGSFPSSLSVFILQCTRSTLRFHNSEIIIVGRSAGHLTGKQAV